MWGDAKLETARKHQALVEPVARQTGAPEYPVTEVTLEIPGR